MKHKERLKTKKVDYSLKVPLRINQKTTIYINAGDDPAKARAAFLKRYAGTFTVPHQQPEAITEKKCGSTCQQVLPVEKFYKNRNTTDGYSSACKSCKISTDKRRKSLNTIPC